MTEEQDNLEKFFFHLSNRLPMLSCEYERMWRIGRLSYNEKRWGHMVAVLRSCMWQITFSASDSDHSRDLEKERVSKGATYHLESCEL